MTWKSARSGSRPTGRRAGDRCQFGASGRRQSWRSARSTRKSKSAQTRSTSRPRARRWERSSRASKMTSVPLNGRNFIDLLALQPGVSPYQCTSSNCNDTTQGVGADETTVSGDQTNGTQSVNGGRMGSNGFMVNGADAQEGVHNGAAIIPNLDSISEFRIITNNFNAEYGNFSGGQINVVTKSGTNRFHGDAVRISPQYRLRCRELLRWRARGDFKQNQFGGTFGGPIKKDKVFFFGDYQGNRQILGQTQSFPVPTARDRMGNLIDESGALAR